MMRSCFNCKETPRFADSDDHEFPVLLVHENRTCPYTKTIYHLDRKLATKKWHELNVPSPSHTVPS